MIRYSPSTGGFYHLGMHATIPADAIEVTAAQHRKLLAEQADGAAIVPHPQTGAPIARKPQGESIAHKLARGQRRIRKQVELRMGASAWPMIHALFRHVTEGAPFDADAQAGFARLAALEHAAAKAERAMFRRKDPDTFDAADPAHWPETASSSDSDRPKRNSQ